jgi:hypothetical protein
VQDDNQLFNMLEKLMLDSARRIDFWDVEGHRLLDVERHCPQDACA